MFLEIWGSESQDEKETWSLLCKHYSNAEGLSLKMQLVVSLVFGPGDCGPPPSLPFASPINQLYGTSFSPGTILKYACRHGFRKVNSSHLTCDENGSWVYAVFCVSEYPPGFSPVLTLLRKCL